MTIVFLSNYFNHHQAALCDALWQQTGGKFCFLETAALPPEQIALGYPLLKREYVLSWNGSEARAQALLQQADVVIAGEAPPALVRVRVKTGKLMFRYSERPARNGAEWGKYLPRLLRWNWRNPPGKPIYLLSAGAYTAGDYARFGLFRNRAFQWGYFPELYPDTGEKKDPLRILWCGRFLQLKHPEAALEAAYRLYREGLPLQLTFLGQGPEEDTLKALVKRYGMEDCVSFPGPKSPQQVRQVMERSGIFLFTSDRQEGWGVVLNEAMNSGCAVIANRGAGASEVLVRHGENGILYSDGSTDAMYENLRYLLEHPQRQKQLGLSAYETIQGTWNAEVAAERTLMLAERILKGEKTPNLFAEGPCSMAKVVCE